MRLLIAITSCCVLAACSDPPGPLQGVEGLTCAPVQDYCPPATLPRWRDPAVPSGATCTLATDADAARLVGEMQACRYLQARARGAN